jgi:mono/diheme cytochrome c family protein
MALSLAASLLFLSCSSSAPPSEADRKPAIPVDPTLAEQGRRIFNLKACNLCHSVDGSPGTGPTLAGIARGADRQALIDWSLDPERVYRREGRRPLRSGFAPMPAQPVSPQEAQALAEYLLTLTRPNGR